MNLIDQQQPYRNTPFEGTHIQTKPLAAAMGGEVLDVQIADLNDKNFSEIEKALHHHKMIFFREQSLSLADQERFTRRFGEFGTDAYTTGMPDHPDIQPVIKEVDTKSKMVFGGGWHTDSPFLECPPSVSILRGVEIPPYGGDTIWYNSVLAYESLSEIMKSMLAPLRVHMSAKNVIYSMRKVAEELKSKSTMSDMELDLDVQSMLDGKYHPIIRRHPQSDEIGLYCDAVYAIGIQGMTERESRPLLDFLVSHITQEIFSCRLRWKPNTVAVWDNRSCLHRAFNDYDGFRREMHRTTVKGEIPIAAFQ
ncbi:TauD/TfdA family dioxygenase [Litorivicinus sp.]|nr:TauD/TfdA family dioxygenase [Litorivicinus sp.]